MKTISHYKTKNIGHYREGPILNAFIIDQNSRTHLMTLIKKIKKKSRGVTVTSGLSVGLLSIKMSKR